MLTYETGSTKVGKTDSWQCNSPLCSSRSNIGTDRAKAEQRSDAAAPAVASTGGQSGDVPEEGCPPAPRRRRASPPETPGRVPCAGVYPLWYLLGEGNGNTATQAEVRLAEMVYSLHFTKKTNPKTKQQKKTTEC